MSLNPIQQIRKYFQKRKELKFFRESSSEEVFTSIYSTNKWGDQNSKSGKGSSLERTERLRAEFPALLEKLETQTLLDIPCGDFYWMQAVPLPIKHYIGGDIVKPMIAENAKRYGDADREFVVLDLLNDKLPQADTIFCRECLVHLSIADIDKCIANIKSSGAIYLLTTNFPEITTNKDIVTGKHRPLNFCAAPWNWPAPILEIVEQDADTRRGRKLLGVWKIADLP